MISFTKYKCQTLDVTSYRYVLVFICMLMIYHYWPPTVAGLQYILSVCEEELLQLDICINVKKSVSIRFGPRFNADCVALSSKFGGTLVLWVNSCRYLGIYIVSGRTLKCAFCNAKSQFFSVIQCGLLQSWRAASEEYVLALLQAKSLPILLYGTEACPLLSRNRRSFEFTVNHRLRIRYYRF